MSSKKFLENQGNPNFFTLLGFFTTLTASIFILKEFWFLAGMAIILSGLFDLFDGALARNLGKVTTFGGFLDSVLDRYSDLFLLLALLIHYLRKGDLTLVIITSFVSIGTALIPYVRARAEARKYPVQYWDHGEGREDHPALCWNLISLDGANPLDLGHPHPFHCTSTNLPCLEENPFSVGERKFKSKIPNPNNFRTPIPNDQKDPTIIRNKSDRFSPGDLCPNECLNKSLMGRYTLRF